MTDRPAKFRDLPASSFPFTMTFFDEATGEQLQQLEVTGPGAIDVPGWAPRRVRVRCEFADGEVVEEGPPGGTASPSGDPLG
jgi:hypothetical protein